MQIHKLNNNATLPTYGSEQAAGMDLYACIDAPLTLEPGATLMIPTGVAMALPPGHEAQVRPRSGLAAKHGITVLNSPGTIDADYRGEVKIILINHGKKAFTINHGDRIAQMVVQRFEQMVFSEVSSVAELGKTARGTGGFGSTGISNTGVSASLD